MKRPELNININVDDFKNFYWLKTELVDFCRLNKIPTTGSKEVLNSRIIYFLQTGKIRLEVKSKSRSNTIKLITLDTTIEENIICSEIHRKFFKSIIGDSFKFNVTFQKWLKENSGKKYSEAIDAYYVIKEQKNNSTTKIDSQFEYNTYIRDFFSDNKDKTLSDAIRCWNYKKSLSGSNKYSIDDLKILK